MVPACPLYRGSTVCMYIYNSQSTSETLTCNRKCTGIWHLHDIQSHGICTYLEEGVKKGGRSVVGVGCNVWGEEDGASLAALCPRMLLVKTDLQCTCTSQEIIARN